MKTIFIFLITGFEEIEAVATVDVLRRAELNVKTISLTGERVVIGAHGIAVTADLLLDEALFAAADLLVVPGGTEAYAHHEGMKAELRTFHEAGKPVAAICAAPAVLGMMGLLRGRRATCYPGYEPYLEGATLQTDQAVVVDGNIVTGRGPGLTIPFALQLVETLVGKAKRDRVAAALLAG